MLEIEEDRKNNINRVRRGIKMYSKTIIKKCILILCLLLMIPSAAFASKFVQFSPDHEVLSFNGPDGIALDKQGNMYIADEWSRCIIKLDSNGNFIKRIGKKIKYEGHEMLPANVTVDDNGNIYVTDTLYNRALKLDSSGNLLCLWKGKYGSSNLEISDPNGITVFNNNVYICDTHNMRVLKFSTSGRYITEYGKKSLGRDFNTEEIDFDKEGNMYVIEHSGISKISSEGNLIASWENFGPDRFMDISDVYVDSSGNIFVVDSNNKYIIKLDSNGNYMEHFVFSGKTEISTPRKFAIDSDGNILVTDSAENRVVKLNSKGEYIQQWGESWKIEGHYQSPYGVTADVYGNIYIADTNNQRIQKLNSNGQILKVWGGLEEYDFSIPEKTAVDDEGNMYVADSGNSRIVKIDSNGSIIDTLGKRGKGNGQFRHPVGIALDDEGNIYVADSDNDRIQKFKNDGTFIKAWGSGQDRTNIDDDCWLAGLALDDSENVYVVDTYNNQIIKFDSDGNIIGTIGNELGLYCPNGIAIDEAGNIYIADRVNDRIVKTDSEGNYIEEWGSKTNDDFDSPHDVSVDLNGNIYVADTGSNRIQVLKRAAALLEVAASIPTSDAKNVPVNNPIVIEFSKDIYEGSSFANISVVEKGGHQISITKSIQGKKLYLQPSASLTEKKQYTVNIPANSVQDEKGNKLLSEYTFSFTTISKLDTTPPTISITSPAKDTTTNQGTCTITGKVSDNDKSNNIHVVLYKEDEEIAEGDFTNTFEFSNIALNAGKNKFSVIAEDSSGNTSVSNSKKDTRVISIDTQVPSLTVNDLTSLDVRPAMSGIQVLSKKINIIGTVSDDVSLAKNIEVKVNNKKVKTNDNGTFSYVLSLKEGTNQIAATAKDQVNNITTSETYTITLLESKPPVIKITAPKKDLLANQSGTYNITGTISESANISLYLQKNDEEEEEIDSEECNGKTFSFDVDLTEGINTIRIEAEDTSGNISVSNAKQDTRKITIDNQAPGLSDITFNGSEADDVEVNTSKLIIEGYISDNISSTVKDFTVSINNKKAKITQVDGLFKFSYTVKLKMGKNIVEITAKDRAGNQCQTESYTVIYNATRG